MIGVFNELWKIDPETFQRYADLPKHGRIRRFLAKNKEELFGGRTDLESLEIKPGWWIGLNNSKASIKKIIESACKVSNLSFGTDLKIFLGD